MIVRWSEVAAGDLQNIYGHLARDKPEKAWPQERLIEARDELRHYPLTRRMGEVKTPANWPSVPSS
jgi:plasmid stabilization system protein ParE